MLVKIPIAYYFTHKERKRTNPATIAYDAYITAYPRMVPIKWTVVYHPSILAVRFGLKLNVPTVDGVNVTPDNKCVLCGGCCNLISYSSDDIFVLAAAQTAHNSLCGPCHFWMATQCLPHRDAVFHAYLALSAWLLPDLAHVIFRQSLARI